MTKPLNKLVTGTDLREHPAVTFWRELDSNGAVPDAIVTLKQQPTEQHKSGIYRLEGVGLGGAAVIAKRCQRETAVIERVIYEEILPCLPLSNLFYYGFVDEPETEFCWLFLEDAGDEEYSKYLEEHRTLAARWLGTLHTSAACIAATEKLPDRGPHHYLTEMRSARNTILQNFANPALAAEDREILNAILAGFDLVELHWSTLQRFCESMPKTLIHGDFADRNVRIRRRSGGTAVLTFDWETSGLGVPAADLVKAEDIAAYRSAVQGYWPEMDLQTLQYLVNVGKLFRGSIAAIKWRTQSLAYPWLETTMSHMRVYQANLRDAIRAVGWKD